MSSQLRVLLVGADELMTETGNALLGREAFTLPKSQAQRETVALPDGRLLQVTAAYYIHHAIGSDGVKRMSEKLASDITSSAYHAVIFIMEIGSSLNLSYPVAAECMIKESWRNFVKRKGLIVVTGGDRFRQARNKGEITVSFIEWMENHGTFCGTFFQETQWRCLLFDNSGLGDVLNKQRQELIDMIDNRMIVGEHYTDMKFKEAEVLSNKLETNLIEETKKEIHKTIAALEEIDKINSQKTDGSLEDMNNQLEGLEEVVRENKERIGVMQTIQNNLVKDTKETEQRSLRFEEHLTDLERAFDQKSEKAAQDSQELKKYLLDLKRQVLEEKNKREEEIQTSIEEFKRHVRESSLWERIKSLALSHTQLHTSWTLTPLLILSLLLLLLLPLLSSLWPVTSNSQREITALDVRSDLRDYVDLKLEQVVKKIQMIEKHVASLNETGLNQVSEIRLEMVDHITELKERLLNETADLAEDIKKNITGRILVWDMIKSLPLSLPLIMVLTLLLLLLTPVPLPVPWAWLLAALLVALLILQLLLLLVLLGV